MALALLRPARVPGAPGTVAFDIDLGSNQFYSYAVGDSEVARDRGFPVLGAPVFTSPIVGPLPLHARGRAVLEIPASRFDREHRSLQLTTYRNAARHGPAVSEIVRVGVTSHVRDDLPSIAFANDLALAPARERVSGSRSLMDTQLVQSYRRERYPDPSYGVEPYRVEALQSAPWRTAEPMRYREVRPISTAMFLGSILPMLKNVISTVAPIVGNVIGKLANAAPTVAPIAGAPVVAPVGGTQGVPIPTPAPPSSDNPFAALGALLGGNAGTGLANLVQANVKPETMKLLTDLLQQIMSAGGTAPKVAEKAQAKALSLRVSRAQEYSHASVAPALLAALPALMPLLQQVLSPETMKGLLDMANPTKLIGAVTDSVKEVGKLGLDFDKQSNEHLRALNPMGVHAPVDDLLKGMGFATAKSADVTVEHGEPAYRRIESVELHFVGASPVMIHGRSRVCYRTGAEIAFALDVKTPRTIPDAVVSVMVKDVETRRVLARKRTRVAQVANGRIPARIALSSADIGNLKTGEDYLVCVYLTWKNAKGKVIGTSRTQMITLIGDYVFDRVEAGAVVPLNDVAKFRPFWHKVWQGSFSAEQWRVDLDGKYYFVLEPQRSGNTPIETRVAISDTEERAKKGRLKSGMTTSLGALNALIPQISDGKPLSEAHLSALASSDFVGRFNTAARFNVSLRGKPGVSAALWVYPEVTLHEVVLFKAASTDADSHVRELTEERVRFPIPVSIHVIGARSAT